MTPSEPDDALDAMESSACASGNLDLAPELLTVQADHRIHVLGEIRAKASISDGLRHRERWRSRRRTRRQCSRAARLANGARRIEIWRRGHKFAKARRMDQTGRLPRPSNEEYLRWVRWRETTLDELTAFQEQMPGPLGVMLQTAGVVMARKLREQGREVADLTDDEMMNLLHVAMLEAAPVGFPHVDRHRLDSALDELFAHVAMDMASNADGSDAKN